MTADVAPATDADRRTVGRALRAGGVTAAFLAVLTGLGSSAAGGDAFAAAVWITSSFVVGALVASGWLVLAMILDLSAGAVPSRRRIGWTLGLFTLAFTAPIVPAALLQVAATR